MSADADRFLDPVDVALQPLAVPMQSLEASNYLRQTRRRRVQFATASGAAGQRTVQAASVQVLPDIGRGETGIQQVLDVGCSDHVGRVVEAVAVVAASRGQQSFLFVVAQCSGAGSDVCGEVTDLHV